MGTVKEMPLALPDTFFHQTDRSTGHTSITWTDFTEVVYLKQALKTLAVLADLWNIFLKHDPSFVFSHRRPL